MTIGGRVLAGWAGRIGYGEFPKSAEGGSVLLLLVGLSRSPEYGGGCCGGPVGEVDGELLPAMKELANDLSPGRDSGAAGREERGLGGPRSACSLISGVRRTMSRNLFRSLR